jgi:hypothetical protein
MDRPGVAAGDDLFDLTQEKSAEAQPETAGVVLAARVHSEPSVSSPTVRFFAPGTELQIVGRENGWVELIDPATQERGWVSESYVWSTGDFSRAKNASLRKDDEFTKPTRQALPRSKRQSRPVITAPQMADKFTMESELRHGRWARRGEPRRRFGLFGRRDASW